MDTLAQLISKQLVDFPTDGIGHDGTQVWLLAYAGQMLGDGWADAPSDITTQLLFSAERFIGLDLTWEQHQKRHAEILRESATDSVPRTYYLTAYEQAAVDTGRPYLWISTMTHPQSARPLMVAPHLYGVFLIGITAISYTDWHCATCDLTKHGQAFYERVKQILPSTVLGLLTLRGTESLVPTEPFVPLVLKSDTDNA